MDQSSKSNRNDGSHLPVITIGGEVDLAAAPALRQQLEDTYAAGNTTVVVDMLAATFLDSTALGVLVSALERCRAGGGELHLVVDDPRVLRVLEITGLVDVFPLHATAATVVR